ncbi:MAG: SWIM zinc finger family protein [Proteobacteria bacterium]|nr:SWIM zinc finger family protein [Pseudomonadota bacterium]
MKITREELYSLVNGPSLVRGKACFKEGLLEFISMEPSLVKAWAMGERAYKVSLSRIGQTLKGSCTCSAFEAAHTCKHLAALGFAIIQYYETGYEPSQEYFEKAAFFKCR